MEDKVKNLTSELKEKWEIRDCFNEAERELRVKLQGGGGGDVAAE